MIINSDGKTLLRCDTEANWNSVNPVLDKGETVVVVLNDGSQRLKCGDGVKRYNSLPFLLADDDGQKIITILNAVYPIGAIYISTNGTNPATVFGIGTWERIGEGRTLIDSGTNYTAGSTGGEAEHTLSISEMPSHGHNTKMWNNNNQNNQAQQYNDNSELVDATSGARIGSLPWQSSAFKTAGSGIGDPNGATELMGGNQAHNNMPPYLAVYIWKRTA